MIDVVVDVDVVAGTAGMEDAGSTLDVDVVGADNGGSAGTDLGAAELHAAIKTPVVTIANPNRRVAISGR